MFCKFCGKKTEGEAQMCNECETRYNNATNVNNNEVQVNNNEIKEDNNIQVNNNNLQLQKFKNEFDKQTLLLSLKITGIALVISLLISQIITMAIKAKQSTNAIVNSLFSYVDLGINKKMFMINLADIFNLSLQNKINFSVTGGIFGIEASEKVVISIHLVILLLIPLIGFIAGWYINRTHINKGKANILILLNTAYMTVASIIISLINRRTIATEANWFMDEGKISAYFNFGSVLFSSFIVIFIINIIVCLIFKHINVKQIKMPAYCESAINFYKKSILFASVSGVVLVIITSIKYKTFALLMLIPNAIGYILQLMFGVPIKLSFDDEILNVSLFSKSTALGIKLLIFVFILSTLYLLYMELEKILRKDKNKFISNVIVFISIISVVQLFINWLCKNYVSQIEMYMGIGSGLMEIILYVIILTSLLAVVIYFLEDKITHKIYELCNSKSRVITYIMLGVISILSIMIPSRSQSGAKINAFKDTSYKNSYNTRLYIDDVFLYDKDKLFVINNDKPCIYSKNKLNELKIESKVKPVEYMATSKSSNIVLFSRDSQIDIINAKGKSLLSSPINYDYYITFNNDYSLVLFDYQNEFKLYNVKTKEYKTLENFNINENTHLFMVFGNNNNIYIADETAQIKEYDIKKKTTQTIVEEYYDLIIKPEGVLLYKLDEESPLIDVTTNKEAKWYLEWSKSSYTLYVNNKVVLRNIINVIKDQNNLICQIGNSSDYYKYDIDNEKLSNITVDIALSLMIKEAK